MLLDSLGLPLMFSPRPWGWSAANEHKLPVDYVLPTPVGMVRSFLRKRQQFSGSPHARGDGPRWGWEQVRVFRFSPRPWGWSGRPGWGGACCGVLPTPVGMVRGRQGPCREQGRSPHARGDGPNLHNDTENEREFSPRPWGWSEMNPIQWARGNVLPTPVGMVRARCKSPCARTSSPHARGDGPLIAGLSVGGKVFSPRPWGWSGSRWACPGRPRVLPTPVGMVRVNSTPSEARRCSPHARGDGPLGPDGTWNR